MEFYCPDYKEDVDHLIQGFLGLTVEDDVDIDEFLQKLAEIRAKVSLVDSESAPSEKSMKKRVLSHFTKYCGWFSMSTIISLNGSPVPSSLRSHQFETPS